MRGDKDVNDDRIWSRNCSGFHPVTTLHLFSFFFWDQPIAVICASGKTWSRSNQAQGIATPPTFPLHINPRFWGRSYNGLLIFKINFTRLNSQQSRPKKEMTPKIWTSTKKVCGYHELVFTKTSVLFYFIACIYIYRPYLQKTNKKTSEKNIRNAQVPDLKRSSLGPEIFVSSSSTAELGPLAIQIWGSKSYSFRWS